MTSKWITIVAVTLAALCGALAPPVAGQTPPANSYTAVQLPGNARGINNSGQVAIYSTGPHCGLWQNGVLTDLGAFAGGYSTAGGINNVGQVIGSSATTNIPNSEHAFLWTSGTGMRDLGTLGGDLSGEIGYDYSKANGVNDAGQVVGASRTRSGEWHAFLWKESGMVDLGSLPGYPYSEAYGINAFGQVVGIAFNTYSESQAFRWTPTVPNGTTGTMVALDPSIHSAAFGINASGQAVGRANGQPIRWDSDGVAHALALVPGYGWGGTGYAINDAGEVAGDSLYVEYYVDPEGYIYYFDHYTAVVWDSAGAGRNLNDLITSGSLSRAVGINSSGQIVTSFDDFLLTPSSVVIPPEKLVATAGNAKISLSWQASSGATGYRVYRSTIYGGPYSFVTAVTSTSHTDTTVTNGTFYHYVVTAVNSQGQETGYSNEASAIPMPPPPAPTGLTATAGDAQVSLSWNASLGADYYYIRRSTTPGGPFDGIYSYTADTSIVDRNSIQNGTTYYYVVTALNIGGESGYSNEASATPMPPPPPPAPTGLTAVASDRQVGLSWNGSAGATEYRVKRATSRGGPYTTIASPDVTGYMDSGLTNGTTYYYVVSAFNSGGEGPNSNEASATPMPPPAAPTGLTATATTAKKQIALKWTQSSSAGVIQNRIYRSTTSGGSYSLRGTVSAGTSYKDTSLTSGVTYYYVVTALSSNGRESAYSNQASAKAR